MKVISKLNNEEGIELLMQIADDLRDIMTDEEVSKAYDSGNFVKIGAAAYKNCKKNVDKIFNALGEKPENALACAAGISAVIFDVFGDPAFKDFFTLMQSKTDTISSASATENTEAEV